MQPVWVEEDEIRRNLPEEDFARLEGLWGVLSSMGEDGGVTKQQFLACQVAVRKSFPELLFDMFDTDRDGVIHRAEFLQGIFFCLTNAYQDIGKSLLFMVVDSKGDGVLSRDQVSFLWSSLKAQLLDDMRRGGMPDSLEDFPSLETHRLQLQEDDPEGINAGVQAIFRLSGEDPSREELVSPEWRRFLDSELFQLLMPMFEIRFEDEPAPANP